MRELMTRNTIKAFTEEGSNSNQEPTIPVKTFKDGISEGIAEVERLIQEKLDANVAADKPTPKKRKEK